MYHFWQATPTSAWTCALASERERVIREHQPALTTVLDVDNAFDRDLTAEEFRAVKYLGPWYADFDGESIEEVIPSFQAIVNELRRRSVDLHSCRFYATGGRGFHIEVPIGTFLPKVPATGVVGLPHIYREIALKLFVDLLDMRVYSAKKGRMWRCAGVKRDNGKYKVQITVDEALRMTTELYDQVCSAPRMPFPVSPATFNPDLGLLYAQAKDVVDTSLKKAKNKKSNTAALKRFKGDWPETVKGIMQDAILKDGVGWNKIAMQLALTADALGKTEEQLLEDAALLCETYAGDSDRYGSFRKRREHLRDMFRYLSGNITYDWSAGGLIALVKPGTDVTDLTAGEFVPDEVPEGEDQAEAAEQEDDGLSNVVKYAKSGIYLRSRDSEGWVRACHVGIHDPVRLIDIREDTVAGYDVEVFVEGKSYGRYELPLKAFAGRAKFQEWAMQWSSAVRGADNDISSLADVLRQRTTRSNNVKYQLHREGVDVIVRRGAKSEDDYDLVYASANGVLSSKGNQYCFRSDFDSNHSNYSDLLMAPEMEDTEASRQLVDAMLKINTPLNLSLALGWMSAAFLCQLIRKVSRRFPALQVYGQAGAGKSSMIETLANLHYYLVPPRKLAAAGQTAYPIIAAVTSHASTPVIFEEVKRREMSKGQMDFLLNVLRNNYDGSNLERGGLSDQPGKGPIIRSYSDVAPLIFLGEGLETQAAILERCVVLSLSKGAREGRERDFEFLEAHRPMLGSLGRKMVSAALAINYDYLRSALDENRAKVREAMGPGASGNDRPVHNHAVTLVGLDFLQAVLQQIFGDRYTEQVENMKASMLANLDVIVPENKSEASRVIDVLARLTREDDVQYKLEKGRDYTVNEVAVDLRLKNVYPKYVRYVRSLGQDPLYDSQAAFIAAMSAYQGVIDTSCDDNLVLKSGPFDTVYRFSVAHLLKEKIESLS